jgi:hypothetical protein
MNSRTEIHNGRKKVFSENSDRANLLKTKILKQVSNKNLDMCSTQTNVLRIVAISTFIFTDVVEWVTGP